MANVLKYKTSQPTKRALRKDNIVLGIGDEGYGPTSTTGYVNGITPPDGGYVVYILSSNNDPAIYVADNDNGLITIANTIGGSVSTVANAKTYLAGRANTWILDNIPNNIVTDGLVLDLNASNLSSYPESGSNWYDLSGNGNDGTLANGPTFNSNGYITFDGSDDYVDVNGFGWTPTSFSVVWLTNPTNMFNYNQVVGANNGWGAFNFHTTVDGGVYVGTDVVNRLTPTNIPAGTLVLNQWQMFCFTYNGTVGAFYKDGNLIASKTMNSSTAWGGLRIGYNSSSTIDGSLGLFKVYDRALSDSEILQNYYGESIVTDGLIFAIDASNLVSYESGSTTVYNLTGSESGSLVNGVEYDSNKGGAWSFDGADDYIGITGVQTPSFSISAWINLSELDRFHGIMGRASSIFTNTSYAFRVINSNKLNIFLSNSGTSAAPYFEVSSTATLQSSTWYHVAITFNKPNVTLYINGNIDVTGTFNYDLYNSTSNSIIGGYTYGNGLNYLMKGRIPNLQFYNRALSAEEITQNYNAQKARYYKYYNGLLTGLESYWKLDEASGTIADSHGSNDGTNSGASYGATGIISDALDFERTDSDYVDCGQFSGLGDSDRTISVWVNIESLPSSTMRVLHLASSTTASGAPAGSLYINSSDQYEASVAGTGDGIVTGGSASTGSWVHLLVTITSGETIEFFVNGSSQGSTTASGTSPSNPYLYIGAYNPTIGQHFDGLIDEVGIWSRKLSSADVTNLYNNGSGLAYGDFTT